MLFGAHLVLLKCFRIGGGELCIKIALVACSDQFEAYEADATMLWLLKLRSVITYRLCGA